ncbi:MAG: DUF6688 family protein [Phycisphaeraceae bacterium]
MPAANHLLLTMLLMTTATPDGNKPTNGDVPAPQAGVVLTADTLCMRCGYNLRGLKLEQDCPECGASITWSIEEARRQGGRDDLTLANMSAFSRTCYLLAGVLLPAVCFALGFALLGPSWQSRQLGDYLWLMFRGSVTWVFYPWLLFSMLSLALIVLRPHRFGGNVYLRAGVITGIPLALQYLVFEACSSAEGALGSASIIAAVEVFVVLLAIGAVTIFNRYRYRITRRWRARIGWTCLIGITLGAVFGWVLVLLGFVLTSFAYLELLIVPLMGMQLLILITAPCWTLTAFALLLVRLRHTPITGRRRWWVWPLWLSGWGASWAAGVHLALIEYAKLPLTPPQDCYVCTAAAHGHGRVVRAHEVSLSHGTSSRVNDQMRRLKAAELALAVVAPRAQRFCRRIYDRLGPRLARRLRHPLLADAAYLALKPLEWLAMALLRLVLPRADRQVARLYRNRAR